MKTMMAVLCAAMAGVVFQAGADTISTNFGMNYYLFGSAGTPALNDPDRLNAYRFTSPEDVEVDRFAFHVFGMAGSPSVHVSIQSDNEGEPSGTILAESTFTPTSTGNYYGLFEDSVNLEQGVVYHVVRSVLNGSAQDSITLLLHTGPVGDVSLIPGNTSGTPKTGQPDPQQNMVNSSNGGTSWTVSDQNSMNAVALGSADGRAVGVPYTQGHASPNIGASSLRGQRFVYDGLTGDQVTNVSLIVRRHTGDAADDLRLYLMTDGGAILSSNVFLSSGFSETKFDEYTLTLSEPVTLTSGEAYRLALESDGSSAASYQVAVRGSTLTNMFDATFQGSDSYLLTGTTGLENMVRDGSSTLHYDMNFNLGIAVIPEPVTLLLGALGWFLIRFRRRPTN